MTTNMRDDDFHQNHRKVIDFGNGIWRYWTPQDEIRQQFREQFHDEQLDKEIKSIKKENI